MSTNHLTLLQQHIKPFTPSTTTVDMELAATAVESAIEQLIAGEIDPNELMMLFHKDHRRLCTYLNFLPDQDKAKTAQALKLLATATQTDITTLDDLRAWIRQEDVDMNAHFQNFEGDHSFTVDFSIKAIDVTTYKLTVDIVTDTENICDMLWERREFETPHPELLMMAIAGASKNLDEVFYTDDPISIIKPITNPMARYHPERAKVTREYINNSSIKPSLLTGEYNDNDQTTILQEMSVLLESLPLKGGLHENSGNTSFLTLNELHLSYYPHFFVSKRK